MFFEPVSDVALCSTQEGFGSGDTDKNSPTPVAGNLQRHRSNRSRGEGEKFGRNGAVFQRYHGAAPVTLLRAAVDAEIEQPDPRGSAHVEAQNCSAIL